MLDHLMCSDFCLEKYQIQVNVRCPGVMVIKSRVQILPGMFSLKKEWFKYLKINRKYVNCTVSLNPVRKVFYLLVSSLDNKDLLKRAISEPFLHCYFGCISPITDFYLIAIFFLYRPYILKDQFEIKSHRDGLNLNRIEVRRAIFSQKRFCSRQPQQF